MFLSTQPKPLIDKYCKYLKAIGSLSKLFSDSPTPYLHYRIHENLFCKAFEAKKHARSDMSADAVKQGVGIGLKTFLENNSRSFQKIAEFNADRDKYKNKEILQQALTIALLRNERLELTKRAYGISALYYHCVTRRNAEMIVYETTVDLINLNRIKLVGRKTAGNFSFSDGQNEYNFNVSKSTLFKRFHTPAKPLVIPIDILADPYDLILTDEKEKPIRELFTEPEQDRVFVILPLYSPDSKKVPARGGLNQWNADGRRRDSAEVYIQIPSWIHKVYPGFFPDRKNSFQLHLPNHAVLSAKICQQNNKALMSNPNKALGEWLLRTVLRIRPHELVTYVHLRKAGVDSVIVFKNSNNSFEMDFRPTGSFESFSITNQP